MKRNLLTLLILALGVATGIASPVELSKAQKAAENFAKSTQTFTTKTDGARLVVATESYYVFNIGNEGFVIISNNDVFRPVVGYSHEGVYPVENPSPEMVYYLDDLSKGRQVALRSSVQQSAEVAREWDMLLHQGVMPARNGNKSSFYLCQTKWDQNDPYNILCPSGNGGRSYAGCVATAMSQVMYYWQYPTQGQGNHTYHHYQYGDLSADFGATTYHFDLMPLTINLMSPAEEIHAVAEFMYHCGIAVDMDYSPDGSGAFSEDVPEAVMSYFGYSNRCRVHNRNDYSLEAFQALMKDQFDMGWPCYYSGSDVDGQGGHAFVCDGYDENDMFHFNWGWSGSGNGFFVIDALNVSGYAFNSGQAVITNFVPSEVIENTMKAPAFFKAIPNGDDAFSVTLSWVNPTATFDGHSVDSIDRIVVTRDGKEVLSFDHPVPGEAVTCVDPAGLPVKVDYTVYAVYHGRGGRRAYANDINLGPTCPWTIKTWGGQDWGNGAVVLLNASGKEVGSFKAEGSETTQTVELPQGWICLQWVAPADSIQVGFEILDVEGQRVFAYEGPSTLMPKGIFFETVNTCGGKGRDEQPSALKAQVDGEDVNLSWVGLADPGYGYNIYRDGILYTMVADTTGFTDAGAASALHSYYVTAFCKEGETYPSNTVCAVTEMEGMTPRDFDCTVTDDGKIDITWSAPENTEDFVGYRIYSKVVGGEYRLVKSLGASYTSYKVMGTPEYGHRYDYKIVAMYDHGHLESTPARSLHNPELRYVELNFTHLPSGLTMEEQDSVLLLSWDPAWRAESYSLYRNGERVADGLTELSYADNLSAEEDRRVYQVTGWVNGVESSPSNKVVFDRTGVHETQPEGVSIYPNPSKGILNVEAESLNEVVVYNLTGQRILSRQGSGSTLSLDLAGLNTGVYVVKVITAHGNSLQKVVLMK